MLTLRPCTNFYREQGNVTSSHIDMYGRDLDWTAPGWMASRCPGEAVQVWAGWVASRCPSARYKCGLAGWPEGA
eukprot:216197-Chlamydomonas_euryale.AAC.1